MKISQKNISRNIKKISNRLCIHKKMERLDEVWKLNILPPLFMSTKSLKWILHFFIIAISAFVKYKIILFYLMPNNTNVAFINQQTVTGGKNVLTFLWIMFVLTILTKLLTAVIRHVSRVSREAPNKHVATRHTLFVFMLFKPLLQSCNEDLRIFWRSAL